MKRSVRNALLAALIQEGMIQPGETITLSITKRKGKRTVSINRGTGASTDASTNPCPIEEHDPKLLFDDSSTTLDSPAGFYPLGIDGVSGIFMPEGDNTDDTLTDTGPRTPASVLPRMPLSGEMQSNGSR